MEGRDRLEENRGEPANRGVVGFGKEVIIFY